MLPRSLVLALAGLVLPTAARADPQADPAERAPTRRALLVGVGEYPELRRVFGARYDAEIGLRGPANDVELVRATLERVLGLEPGRTRVLVDASDDDALRPTRANVLAELARLAEEAQEGDLVVLYFAGHGTQQRVVRAKGGEEPDGLEEVFLAADARPAEREQGHVPGSIRDDEIGAAARAIRDTGASVWLIVDACHSGTMLRGGAGEPSSGIRLRGLPPELFGAGGGLRGGGGTARAPSWLEGADTERIAALYGSTSYGRAPEMDLPRGTAQARAHGLFTFLLCRELERAGAGLSFRELSARVVAAYQAFPCALTVPTAEGDLDRRIDDGRTGASELVAFLRRGEPVLDRGRLAGIDPGVTAELLELDHVGERRVALLEVVDANLFEARARLVEGALGSGGPWRARVASRPLGDSRLALAVVREDGTPFDPTGLSDALRAELAGLASRVTLVPDAVAADWSLVRLDDGRLRLRPSAQEAAFDVLDPDPARLASSLERIYRARTLRRYAGSDFSCRWGGALDVWIERRAGRGWTRAESGGSLRPGDTIRVRMRKETDEIVDVSVFYLDANDAVIPLFPARGRSPRLAAGATGVQELLTTTITDDALGLEHLLVFATPRGEASPEVDLGAIVQSGVLRGGPESRDPFAALLRDLLASGDLRGEPLRPPPQAGGTQALLQTFFVAWGPLAAPGWPSRSAALDGPVPEVLTGLEALPEPCRPGARLARVALDRSEPGRAGFDVLLLGGERVEVVLVDLDGEAPRDAEPSELLRADGFDAEVAFVPGPPARAAYDRDDRGAFDLVLSDADGDGVAEERWTRGADGWIHDRGIAQPLWSQAYLHVPGDRRAECTRRLAALRADR